MTNTFPSRIVEDKLVFTAVCKSDSSERFTINAINETFARVELLDKIGYAIFESPDGIFQIVDADDDSLVALLKATSLIAAVEESMQYLDWTLSEPTELIGGSLGSGFGFEEQK